MKLAIVGTAGRKEDRQKLTPAHWRMMEIIGQTVATTLKADELISGGASAAFAYDTASRASGGPLVVHPTLDPKLVAGTQKEVFGWMEKNLDVPVGISSFGPTYARKAFLLDSSS